MSGNQKSRGRWLIKEFPNRNGASVAWRTFCRRLWTTGSFERAPAVDVRALRALLRTSTLWGTLYRARRINRRHTAPLDSTQESSDYLKHQSCVSYTTTYHWSASRERRQAHELTAVNPTARFQRAGQLLQRFSGSNVDYIFFTDEKILHCFLAVRHSEWQIVRGLIQQ